jgi:hypothetical protein
MQLDTPFPDLRVFKEELGNKMSISKPLMRDIENYSRFLRLIKIYPYLRAVPTKSIDLIWHYHLSDYHLYARDCLAYFGYMIRHVPSTKKEQHRAQILMYMHTKQLWMNVYQDELGSLSQMAFCGISGGDDGNDDGGKD